MLIQSKAGSEAQMIFIAEEEALPAQEVLNAARLPRAFQQLCSCVTKHSHRLLKSLWTNLCTSQKIL